MKNLFFFFWLLPVLCFAQIETELEEDHDLVAKMAHITEHLDFSEVTSGLLWDKSAQVFPIDRYLDPHSGDSTYMDDILFGLLYASLSTAHVTPANQLPDPEVAYADVVNSLEDGDPIPFALVLQSFHRLKDNAESANLIQETNGQFFDVPNRPESPYEEDLLFVATPLVSRTKLNQAEFYFSDNFIFNNTPRSIDHIYIDFDDGSGMQLVDKNTSFTINLGAKGQKLFQMRCELDDGTTLNAKAIFSSPKETGGSRYSEEPDVNIFIPPTAEHDGLTMNIFYACPDQQLKKPVLVIEGADPPTTGNTDYTKMLDLLSVVPEDNTEGKTVLEIYDDLGEIDLIFMDFVNGTDDMRDNAAAVRDAIIWINQEKANNGSSEPNILVGVSMGGPIGKWALLDMEADGVDHEVKKYIAYDAPMRGNYFSLGLQHMARHLTNISLGPKKIWQYIPVVGEYRDIMLDDANKQMLFYHAFELSNVEPTYQEHYDFYSQLAAKGNLQQCEYVVLTCGSQLGVKDWLVEDGSQIFDAGAKLMDIQGVVQNGIVNGMFPLSSLAPTSGNALIDAAVAALISRIQGDLDLDVWSLPPEDRTPKSKIYRGTIRARFGNFPLIFSHYKYKAKGLIPYDSSPGSISDLGLGRIKGFESISPFLDGLIDVDFEATCFIPIGSALDVNLDMKDLATMERDYSDNDEVLNSGITAIDRFLASSDDDNLTFGIYQHNQEHPSLHPYNAAFLIEETLDEAGIGITDYILDDRIYNYGLENGSGYDIAPIRNNININGNGQLWINRDDRIEYTDETSNPQNSLNSHLNVYLNSFCLEEATSIRVVDGGKMRIGEWDVAHNSGSLQIGDNGVLFIDNDGYVEINQNSEIRVRAGGKIKIKTGGRLRAKKGGQLIIEEGAILEVEEGAFIDLFWHASNIHIKGGGEFICDGNFKFDGYGYFQFDRDNIFTQHGKLAINGQNDRFIRLNYGARLRINEHGIDLRNGEVEYRGESAITTSAGADIHMENMRFEGYQTDPFHNYGLDINEASKIFIWNCEFDKLATGMHAVNNDVDIPFFVRNTTFNNCISGAEVGNFHHASFIGCDFFAKEFGAVAVIFQEVDWGGLQGCEVTGYHFNDEYNGAVTINRVNNAYLSSNQIHDNRYGISLVDVFALRVLHGSIYDNSEMGISVPLKIDGVENRSNIFLSSQAQIRNNEIGIHIPSGGSDDPNGEYYGMVLMDCAEMKDNVKGIYGNNIILQIDAYINADTDDPAEIRPNKIHGSGRYFDICYTLGSQVEVVPATGNYWGGGQPSSSQYKLNNQSTSCGTFGGILDPSLPVNVEPTDCNEGDGPINPADFPVAVDPIYENPDSLGGNGPDCSIVGNNDGMKLNDIHFNGYQKFRGGQYEEARQAFAQTAGISSFAQASASPLCKHFINVAKVMAQGDGVMFKTVKEDVAIAQSRNKAVKLYPNPSNSIFNVEYEDQNFKLSIYDLVGQLIHVDSYFHRATLQAQNWAPGMYIIELHNTETNEKIQEKMLIEH